jgi:hypothetical protein
LAHAHQYCYSDPVTNAIAVADTIAHAHAYAYTHANPNPDGYAGANGGVPHGR